MPPSAGASTWDSVSTPSPATDPLGFAADIFEPQAPETREAAAAETIELAAGAFSDTMEPEALAGAFIDMVEPAPRGARQADASGGGPSASVEMASSHCDFCGLKKYLFAGPGACGVPPITSKYLLCMSLRICRSCFSAWRLDSEKL